MKTLMIIGLLLVSMIFAVSKADTSPVASCSPAVPADIIFLIDATSKSTDEGYQRGQQIVINIIKNLTISQDATHVGVVMGNVRRRPLSGLSDDKDSILNELTYTSWRPSVNETLQEALYMMYEYSVERRQAKKIYVFVTDSTYDDNSDNELWAQRAKDNFITIFTIGVQPGADDNQLKALASKPEYSLPADDFSTLNDFICNETPYLPGTPAEIMISLDYSNSSDVFNRYLQLVDKILENVTLSENGTHVALYSCNAEPAQPIMLTWDRDLLQQKIGKLQYKETNSQDCDSALYIAPIFHPEEGIRWYAKKIALLLTDRKSLDAQSIEHLAESADTLETYLRVTVFTLGIQPGATEEELNAVASRPEYNLPPDDFSALTDFIYNVSKIKAS